jgi:hypothetical protein
VLFLLILLLFSGSGTIKRNLARHADDGLNLAADVL